MVTGQSPGWAALGQHGASSEQPLRAKTVEPPTWTASRGVTLLPLTDHPTELLQSSQDRKHAAGGTSDGLGDLQTVKFPCAPEPGNRLVIDGWHRIHRAITEGLEELPAILLTATDERTCRLHG